MQGRMEIHIESVVKLEIMEMGEGCVWLADGVRLGVGCLLRLVFVCWAGI